MRGKLWFGAATAALLMSFAPAASAQDNDPAGDPSTTATFSTGATVQSEIGTAGDVDWYRMGVEHGQRYSFTLDGVPGADGQTTLDPMLGIYDENGNQLAFNDDANGSLNSALQYAPGASGNIYIEARAFSDQGTGAYRLSATAGPLPQDDAGNDVSTRARVNIGRAVNGNIEYEGDTDWYRLSVRTGQRYHIALAGTEGAQNPVGDPILRVLDADGNELAMNDDSAESLNSALDFVPRANGDVFIEAGAYASAYTGAYTLNVTAERMPRDATSGDRNTRGRINAGQSINASLDFPSDTDWYRIRLNEGESYRFTLVSSGDSPVGDPLIAIYNAAGEQIAYDDDGGEGFNSYLEFTAPAAGNYFVEARGFAEDAVGGYTLSARAGDTPSDASTDVTLDAGGDYREGVLAPAGDRDWYRIELTEGQALRLGASSNTGVTDPLGDPYIVLYSADGTELARDDDGGEGLNAWLEYQATTSGPHYLEVRGFTEDAAGRYVVSLVPGEIGQTFEDADHIVPGGENRESVIGTPEDVDWFGVELVEGRPYRINVEGSGANPLADPYLRIYDSQGVEVAADDDGGTGFNSYLNFASATGGSYFVAVSAFGGSEPGQYSLRISDTDVPGHVYTDENLDSASDSRNSSIEMAGDLDYYRVQLEAGVRYVIDVRGEGADPLTDAFVAIHDSENNRITSDDDGGDGLDARLRFTPETSGEYYIQASGLGGSTGTYQVQIVRQ